MLQYVPFANATEAAKHGILKMYIDRYVQQEGNVYIDDPVTDLVYPIHDAFFGESKVIGLVHAHLGWRSFFTNALPEGDGPLIATLHSECSDMYTYYVDGPSVEYIGSGGNHEAADTTTKFARDFHTFDKVFSVPDEERADGECFYMFHVHAAHEMKTLYVNNDAMIFAIIIAAVFIFTSLVFIAYDYAVKRNQHKVMQSALRSGAIVSSLFPKAVRDRMFQESNIASEKQKDAEKGTFRNNIEQHPLSRTHGSTHGEDSCHGGGGGTFVRNSDPVADLYPDCTVLFTDIAGFTKWSSERNPVEVFKLLETLYGQFDRIAKRRQVFKVETVSGPAITA
jgi:Adenylate and Guanylate cyclase catalytic domain